MTATTLHIPTLETERLILRAPHWADFEAYAAYCASERSRANGGPYTREQSFARMSALIGHWHLRGYGRWMITDRETNHALGIVGIFYPEGWPEPELAWTVFAEAEGKGIAFEAATAARAYAYETLGWPSLISLVANDNTRSIALAKRMGCAYEGDFEHADHGPLPVWRHPEAA